MSLEFMIFSMVIAILGLALFGFVMLLKLLFGAKTKQADVHGNRQDKAPSTLKHVLATCELVDRLFQQKHLSSEAYQEVRQSLENQYGRFLDLPPRVLLAEPDSNELVRSSEARLAVDDEEVIVASLADGQTIAMERPDNGKNKADEVLAIPTQSPESAEGLEPDPTMVTSAVAKPASPFDIPNEPLADAPRTLKEMLAGFMEKKNIRWGELASGVLIVGSAVGLVFSLRDVLQDRIPYFTAILFLLITAAIHAAGIYTLKKWKLRNTSRGVLAIGMLLIPLNFFAACLLTGNGIEKRELTDPLYWTAIVVGVSALGAMAWLSGQHLLRKYGLPVVIAVLGISVWSLVINRAEMISDSTIKILSLIGPATAAFLMATWRIVPRQWSRTRLGSRLESRILLVLGIALFAFASVVMLMLVRSEYRSVTLVGLVPAFTTVALMVCGIAGVIRDVGPHRPKSALVGLSLVIIGGFIVVTGSLFSFANSLLLFTNAALLVVGLAVISWNRRWPQAMAGVWVGVWMMLFSGLMLFQSGEIETWHSARQVAGQLLDGWTAVSLMAVGLFAALAGKLLPTRSQVPSSIVHRVSGASLAVAGCSLALLASFLNPESVTDSVIATTLLGLLATGILIAACRSRIRWLPVAASIVLLVFMWHLLFWNPVSRHWLSDSQFPIDVRLLSIFTLIALATSLGALVRRFRGLAGEAFTIISFASCVIAFGIGSFSVYAQSGLVAFAAVTLLLSATYLAWGYRFELVGILFPIASLACVALLVADLVVVAEWSPSLIHLQHWLIQLSLTGIGCAFWAMFRTWSPNDWQTNLSLQNSEASSVVESWILSGLAFSFVATVSCLVYEQAGFEFSRSWQGFPWESFLPVDLRRWLIAVAAVLLATTAFVYYLRPSWASAIGMIVLWFSAGLASTLYFAESRGVASAIRWLIPTAGLIGACLFMLLRKLQPLIDFSRAKLSILGPSKLTPVQTQWMVNTSLLLSVVVTLGVSTITITTVMLNGAEVLGGPLKPSLLGDLRKDVSFGAPIAILVATFLIFAISERRSVLAAMGSSVFQYVVVLAIVLLAISPNPKLATTWFVNILQAVSLGMTGYGLIWFLNRKRIGGEALGWLPNQWKQLDLHVILNIALISSLMVLVIQRYYLSPLSSAGWIQSAGGPMGVVSIIFVSLLSILVWKDSLAQVVPWGFGYLGLASTAIAATIVDQQFDGQAWLAFRTIGIGALITLACQFAFCWIRDFKFWTQASGTGNKPPWFATWHTAGSILALTIVSVLFALRGVVNDGQAFWLHWSCLSGALVLVVAYSWVYRSRVGAIGSAVLTGLVATMFCAYNPYQWFNGAESLALIFVMALSLLAMAWIAFYLISRYFLWQTISRSFHRLPNLITLAASIWMLSSGMFELVSSSSGFQSFDSGLLPIAIGFTAMLLLVQTWNDRASWMVTSRLLWLFGWMTLLASVAVDRMGITAFKELTQVKFTSWLLVIGCTSLFWGLTWLYRKSLFRVLKAVKVPRLVASDRRLERQLPLWLIAMAMFVLLLVWFAIFNLETRTLRYLTAFVPVMVAGGIGCLALTVQRPWLQKLFIGLLVVGMVLVSWASLSPEQMTGVIPELPSRTLMVLAFTVFVLGALATRWTRHGDRWLESLKAMTIVVSGAALLMLILCTVAQLSGFDRATGSGLSQGSAVGSSMAILSMIVGLLTIAVLPKHDPLSVSLSGRKAYVYTAQVVVALLGVHVYLAMPWLLQLGVLKYWPYVALVLSFTGIAVSSLLQNRKLEVLAEPLFNTAAIVPLLVAIGFWFVRSEADAALTFLSAGLVYLAVSVMHRSLWAGGMSMVLGNIALWTFYHERPEFSFFEHPQLWLIPPALSVLVASQLLRQKLPSSQLGVIRYFCAFVIYLSSTGEVFINGLGLSLWPPIVLALLSLGGMAAGIMLQVRSFLYVGSVFLLMSMVAMVSHAHRQFNHVWPWWAFGICVGVAILVGFGLLEKKRNDLAALGRKLEQWDV